MRASLLKIPELMDLEAGQGLVRIPEEQNVPFTPRVRALVDTSDFRRLAHITQLGLVSQVYPGARHSRFEHALGVYHNALRYLWQLAQDPRFSDVVDSHTAEVLIVSALLHDLGHWPFCHPIEDLGLPSLILHEDFAAEHLAPGSEIAQVLEAEWSIQPAEVLDVLVPKTDSPRLRLLRSILSGPIDIDKLDYLERDSLHAGVPYGRNFDKNRLIQSLLLNGAGDGLALSSKGRTAAELMVFARYVMFSEVYWHHAVRSATCMFARGFFELHQRLDLKTLFLLAEPEMIRVLGDEARGTLAEGMFAGIFGLKRQIHKRIAEYSHYQDAETHSLLAGRPFGVLVRCAELLAQRFTAVLGEPLTATDVLIDAPPPHREVEFDIPIYYPKERVYRPLDEVSPVVAVLAREQFDDYVKKVRVYGHPRITRKLSELPDFREHLHAAAHDAGL
ncbi:MAG: HD domain-containing protein [Planctomycetales bacterium]